MSRSGYVDDYWDDQWAAICYRGAVESATKGARGQKLLRDMRDALDAMPDKALIPYELEAENGAVCALGAVGKSRGLDMTGIDPEDAEAVAAAFDIAPALAREITFWNDEGALGPDSQKRRFNRMRVWVNSQIRE